MAISRYFSILQSVFLASKKIKKPLSVSWVVTRRCNGQCLYCAGSNDNDGLSTADSLRLLGELKKGGVQYVSMTGGEVLLREDIGLIVDAAHRHRFFVKLNTNGLLLAQRIDDVGKVDVISLSVDGDAPVHDAVRGQGSFQRVMQGLEVAVGRKKRVIISAVISRYNTGKLHQVLRLGAQYRVPVVFQPARMQICGCEAENPTAPNREDFRQDVYWLMACKRQGGIGRYIQNSLTGLQHFLSWPESAPAPCYAGLLHFRVDVEGYLHNCDDTVRSKKIKIFPGGFLKAVHALQYSPCQQCWCAAQVEGNLVMALKGEAVLNHLTH